MHKNQLSRLDNCLEALKWVFDTAIARGINTIIFGGDLFQDRQKIHVISYEKTFRLIRKYCSENPDLKLFLLVGNHDMWYNEKWDVSSVAPLEAIDNVKVIAQPMAVEVTDDCTVDFLPYTKNPVEDVHTYFPTKNRILVSHVALDGAQLNSMYNTKAEISVEFEGDMVKVDLKTFEGWERVFLGHYHSAQKMNDIVEYIGSPLELNFGEAHCEKHIIVLDTDTLEVEYVVNDFSPKHLIIKESQIDKYDLEGNFVQIIVDDIASTDIIDLRKTVLKDRGIATLEFKEKNVKKEDVPKTDMQQLLTNMNEGGDTILEKWAKAHGHDSLDLDKLLTIGQDIIRRSQ
jgi:DNA repair exonuclease SbcCD nuclease subunit